MFLWEAAMSSRLGGMLLLWLSFLGFSYLARRSFKSLFSFFNEAFSFSRLPTRRFRRELSEERLSTDDSSLDMRSINISKAVSPSVRTEDIGLDARLVVEACPACLALRVLFFISGAKVRKKNETTKQNEVYFIDYQLAVKIRLLRFFSEKSLVGGTGFCLWHLNPSLWHT